MVKLKASRLQMNAMGQSSSQERHPSGAEHELEQEGKSSDRNHKSNRRKRKSVEGDHALDEEQSQEQSARVLLQMREGCTKTRATRSSDDLAASQRLITENSELHSPRLSNGDESEVELSQKPKKRQKNDKTKQKRRSADTDIFPGSKDGDEASHYPRPPSTPPGQTDRSSPPPYRPSISQSHHALDEVSTDDEAAVFDQEFGNGASSDEAAVPNPDIYSFSQQPQKIHSQKDSVHPPYQLPVKAYEKRKKRKRHITSDSHIMSEEQLLSGNGEGQHTLDFGFEQEIFDTHLDTHLYHDSNSANAFGQYEGNEIPIDPELHSMSALPPAVDLSALDAGNASVRPKRKVNLNGSLQPKKHRRMEDPGSVLGVQGSYSDPSMVHDDQENIQDHVLPGLEDMQRQTSPELGTPFMEDLARGGLNYLNSAPKSAKRSSQERTKGHSESTSATQSKSSQKKEHCGRSVKEFSAKGGAFTPAEFAKLDNFREKYCDANNMNRGHFNKLIQSSIKGNAQVAALFNQLHELLPYRPRMSVQKCVRRRFHNYTARGTWTAEEDEELRRAVEEKGKSWKVVGEMIDRMPGDCRDRWRNYLYKPENRNREQWTDEEVKDLCRGILECIQLMKHERRRAREEKYGPNASELDEDPDQEVEDMKLINWQTVSDRMGNGRSRLQCSFKWGQLKKKDQKNLLRNIREAGGLEAPRPGSSKKSWRRRLTAKKTANMRTGDQYMLIKAVLDSDASTEGNIPWRSLGDDAFRANWNGPAKKMAWQKLKKIVPDSESMEYHQVADQLLEHITAEGSGELDERWDPEVHGDMSKPRKERKAKGKEAAEDGEMPKRKRRPQTGNERRATAMSTEFVQESDDQDESDGVHEPQDYNRYEALPRSERANRYADVNHRPVSTTEDEGELDNTGNTQDSDQDSLFDEPIHRSGHQPNVNGSVSPEMASKIRSLKSFM